MILPLLTSCKFDYLIYCTHISPENEDYNYVVYTDNRGIGDIEFSVLKVEKEYNPKNLEFKWGFNERDTVAEKWIKERTLLANYSEAGYNTNNEELDLVDGRFLVFSRGNMNYGLYDLKADSAVFNDYSPWHSWLETYEKPDDKYDAKREKASYDKWILENYEKKIKEYIEKNK